MINNIKKFHVKHKNGMKNRQKAKKDREKYAKTLFLCQKCPFLLFCPSVVKICLNEPRLGRLSFMDAFYMKFPLECGFLYVFIAFISLGACLAFFWRLWGAFSLIFALSLWLYSIIICLSVFFSGLLWLIGKGTLLNGHL